MGLGDQPAPTFSVLYTRDESSFFSNVYRLGMEGVFPQALQLHFAALRKTHVFIQHACFALDQEPHPDFTCVGNSLREVKENLPKE